MSTQMMPEIEHNPLTEDWEVYNDLFYEDLDYPEDWDFYDDTLLEDLDEDWDPFKDREVEGPSPRAEAGDEVF